MKINLENNLQKLEKLRELVLADIDYNNNNNGFEDIEYEFEEWLNEIDGSIAKLKKIIV